VLSQIRTGIEVRAARWDEERCRWELDTSAGAHTAADVIVLATGFASHAFVAPMEIVGVGGRTLSQEWGGVPRAYLGLSVPSFPSLFPLYGPNTNGGTGSVVFAIEAAINHVLAALRALERAGSDRIELRRDAAERFDRELRQALGKTVWHSGCTNWYLDEHGNDPNPVAVDVEPLPTAHGQNPGRYLRAAPERFARRRTRVSSVHARSTLSRRRACADPGDHRAALHAAGRSGAHCR
jgi:cation diffusion facilitator CzcD-associated flavoprotein CzcO